MVFMLEISKQNNLKLDFVDDTTKLLNKLNYFSGFPVLSLEDIYLRKIQIVTGFIPQMNTIGQNVFAGGRQEAKDFFDLYFLSHTFMPLSKFLIKYTDMIGIESFIKWYRTYDRMTVKLGLLDLITDKKLDYQAMDKHFHQELNILLDFIIGDV